MGIKTHGHMGRLLIVEEINQGIGKSKLGIGVFALGSDARIANQGVISPENEGKGVQEEEFLFLHGAKLGIWRKVSAKIRSPRFWRGEPDTIIQAIDGGLVLG
jgi:hypothetical protein